MSLRPIVRLGRSRSGLLGLGMAAMMPRGMLAAACFSRTTCPEASSRVLRRFSSAPRIQMSNAGPGGAETPPPAVVEIEYCGYYTALKLEIENRFGSSVQVVPNRNAGSTGNFEVTLLSGEAPRLIHSKATRRQGRCETEEEVDDVLDAIDAFLASVKA